MKQLYLICLNILFLTNFALAHKEPAKISGLAIYDDSRPLEVHIFCSLPLLKEAFQFNFISPDLYHKRQEERLRKAILEHKDKFIEFSSQDKKIPVFIKRVEIISDTENDGLPPGLNFSKNIDINITLLFSTPLNAKELKGKWLIFPDAILDLEKAYGKNPAPSNYEISLTYTGDKVQTFKNSKAKPEFIWKNSRIKKVEPEVIYSEQKTVLKTNLQKSFETGLIGAFLIFLYWIFSKNARVRSTIVLLAVINLGAYLYMTDLTEYKTEKIAILPKDKELTKLIKYRLESIYSTLSYKDKERLYDSLADVTTKEFLKQTYSQMHNSIFINNKTLKIVDKVTIKKAAVLNEKQIKCEWEIDALVRHQNHIHPKKLSFSAIFDFNFENKWQISKGHILPEYEFAKND